MSKRVAILAISLWSSAQFAHASVFSNLGPGDSHGTMATCVLAIMGLGKLHKDKGASTGNGLAMMGVMAAIAWAGLSVLR